VNECCMKYDMNMYFAPKLGHAGASIFHLHNYIPTTTFSYSIRIWPTFTSGICYWCLPTDATVCPKSIKLLCLPEVHKTAITPTFMTHTSAIFLCLFAPSYYTFYIQHQNMYVALCMYVCMYVERNQVMRCKVGNAVPHILNL
jgi:hypothetical protein